jgi:REP element-mobilizing transposase RayT
MKLYEMGSIASNQWIGLAERFPNVAFGEFVIMPNHMHGIIIINEPSVGAGFHSPVHTPAQNVGSNSTIEYTGTVIHSNTISQNNIIFPSWVPARGTPTVGDIVGVYKSLVFRDCLTLCKKQEKYLGKLWQRNYFEHIIRNETAYQKIVDYILTNPLKWEEDKYFNSL